MSGGIHVPGCRACAPPIAARSAQTCRCEHVHSSSAPSSVRPVFARKTSSSDGWCRLISRGAQVLVVERADHIRQRTVAVELHGARAGARGRLGAEAREERRAAARARRRRSGTTSTVGLPISRLQLRRRALGDDPAVVDDPDAVGEHVGLLEVLRRQEDGHALVAREPADLLPERGAALRVEARSSARRGRGSTGVDQREREVEPALHAARVRADLAVAGRRRARRGRAARSISSCRFAPRMPCSEACSRRCSRPVRNGSSAVSCSAAPIAARTCGPSRTTSKPATVARPAGGREERGQHVDGRRLAGAVRAEEAVDLARARSAGRSRRPRATSLNCRTRPSTSIPLSLRLSRHIRRTYRRSPDGRGFARYT